MIPKIIHYCWFGKAKKSEAISNYIKKFHDLEIYGYQVIEWNEDNFSIDKSEFLKNAYEKKRWAHVSDYVRLDVLYNYGGIYLDTDVEIVKNFDELLTFDMFLGFMWDCNLGTAVLGVQKRNVDIKNMLLLYENNSISLSSPNNDLFTRYFLENHKDLRLNGKEQYLDSGKIAVFCKNNFEHPSFMKKKNYTVHHFNQSWKNENPIKKNIKKIVIKLVGLYIYRIYICKKSLKMSPFYERYKKDI